MNDEKAHMKKLNLKMQTAKEVILSIKSSVQIHTFVSIENKK